MTLMPGRKDPEIYTVERAAVGVAPVSAPAPSDGTPVSAELTRLIELLTVGWSYRGTIALLTAIGLCLGWLVSVAMGPTYTAVAVLRPNLLSDAPEKGSQAPNLDANYLVASEIELITSQPLAPAFAAKLNQEYPANRNDRSFLAPVMQSISAVKDFLRCSISSVKGSSPSGQTPGDQQEASCPGASDPAAIDDIKLRVEPLSRTYLIEVTLKASTAERAAAFANAVASQYARNIQLKQARARIAGSEQALAGLLATYGDRHPLVRRARVELELLRQNIETFAAMPTSVSEKDLIGGDIVVPARAASLSANSRYKTIAAWALLGLIAALGFVLFKERNRLLV